LSKAGEKGDAKAQQKVDGTGRFRGERVAQRAWELAGATRAQDGASLSEGPRGPKKLLKEKDKESGGARWNAPRKGSL
jgi:hypothetical protein